MITREHQFFRPRNLDEALEVFEHFGDDAKILAGGMTLVPMMTLGLVASKAVISLNHVSGLGEVEEDGDFIRIGALARHETVQRSELVRAHVPLLAEAAGSIGDPQIRHRGTIGGSLAHADPAADYPPVMLVLGAELEIRSRKRQRTITASEFFKGLLETDLRPGEVLTAIRIAKPPKGTGSAYRRLHRVQGNFPIVCAAAIAGPSPGTARIGLGGVGPTAVLIEVGGKLTGPLTDDALRAVGDSAHEAAREAFSDLNAGVEYRREMARIYALRALRAAAEAAHRGQLRDGGPEG